MPDEIALLRENKDIGKHSTNVLVEVEQYVKILDTLLSYYKGLSTAIEEL